MPELPWAKRERFKKDLGMTDKEAEAFTESADLSAYFGSIIKGFAGDARKVRLTVNYLLTDYLGLLKKAGGIDLNMAEFDDTSKPAGPENKSDSPSLNDEKAIETVSPSSFAELIEMIASNEISSRGAKDLLGLLFNEGLSSDQPSGKLAVPARALAEKHGLLQKSDAADISPIIEKVVAGNAKVAADYKAGKTASLQFLIGQAMKAAKGSANPEVVKKLLVEKLG